MAACQVVRDACQVHRCQQRLDSALLPVNSRAVGLRPRGHDHRPVTKQKLPAYILNIDLSQASVPLVPGVLKKHAVRRASRKQT
jgi:hypothetical protein